MKLLRDASALYRLVQDNDVFQFNIPYCDFGVLLQSLDPNTYINGLLNTEKVAFSIGTFEIDDWLLKDYSSVVKVDRNVKSNKDASFESCLFYFMLEFKRDLQSDPRLQRLLRMVTPRTSHRFADDIAELRDNYKVYTLLYGGSGVDADYFRQLLTNSIMYKCAEILEFVLEKKVYSNINMMSLRYLLNLFLFTVHTTHPELKKQTFQFDLYYLNLYCHCIRHHRVKSHGADSFTIENDFAGRTLTVVVPKKLFVKLCISLVNIFAYAHGHEENLYLPREVMRLLGVAASVEQKFYRVAGGNVEPLSKAEYAMLHANARTRLNSRATRSLRRLSQ
jgi:hypothetical protein